jgi:hypothetical protein
MIVHCALNSTLKRTWKENDNKGLGIECILNWKMVVIKLMLLSWAQKTTSIRTKPRTQQGEQIIRNASQV